MDSEGKFWFSIWSMGAAFLVALCVVGTVAGQLEREKLAEMVKDGADPMRAACALGVGDSNKALCTVIATKAP